MTLEQIGSIIKMIRVAYNEPGFLGTQEAKEVWRGFFMDMEYRTVNEATKRHIKSSRNVPTIADIMNMIKVVEAERKEVLKTLKDYFLNARAFMPRDMLRETDYAVFMDLIKSKTYEEALRKGKIIGFETKTYLEKNYRTKGLTFETCMREVLKNHDEGRV